MAFKKKKNKNKIKQVYEIGDLVLLHKKKKGVIKYIGQIHSRDGIWYGIELIDAKKGENDGYVGRTRYFEPSTKGAGVFVKPKKLVQILEKGKKKKKPSPPPPKKKKPSPPPQPKQTLQNNQQQQRPQSTKHSHYSTNLCNASGVLSKQSKHNKSKTITLDGQSIMDSTTSLISTGSPRAPADFVGSDSDIHVDYDKAMDFDPMRAPSQQHFSVESTFMRMTQKIPKKVVYNYDDKRTNHSNGYNELSVINEEIQRLNESLELSNDSIIETKRIKIKQELNNLRPIELMEKLSEYMENNKLDLNTIQLLQKMISTRQ